MNNPIVRHAFKLAVTIIRPLRFTLGISRKVERPLSELLKL
jgi:hypothetical protein